MAANNRDSQNFNIPVVGQPTRRSLRVNVHPVSQTISIKDIAVHIGLDRSEALALARALTQAADALDDTTEA